MDEIWVNIEEFEDLYQISNLGRYRSFHFKNPKICKPNKIKGYLYARLYRSKELTRMSIHRLVATYFIPNPDNLPEVNHKDGNKENNHASNLEWSTSQDNVKHAWETGLRRYTDIQRETTSNKLSKKVYQLDIDTNKIINEFKSAIEASKYIKCTNSAISNCCLLKSDTVKGYRWRYEETLYRIKETKARNNKKRIAKKSKSGELLYIYDSLKDASDDYGKSPQTICDYLKGRYNDNNFNWEYIEGEDNV